MDWLPALTIVLGNAAVVIPLFIWNRSESRADYRHMDAWARANIDAIREEMNDLHSRLCVIEERNRK